MTRHNDELKETNLQMDQPPVPLAVELGEAKKGFVGYEQQLSSSDDGGVHMADNLTKDLCGIAAMDCSNPISGAQAVKFGL